MVIRRNIIRTVQHLLRLKPGEERDQLKVEIERGNAPGNQERVQAALEACHGLEPHDPEHRPRAAGVRIKACLPELAHDAAAGGAELEEQILAHAEEPAVA